MVSLALAIAIIGIARYAPDKFDNGVFIVFLPTGIFDVFIVLAIWG